MIMTSTKRMTSMKFVGEGRDQLDVFIPLNMTFTADVPSDKRGVGGLVMCERAIS